MTEETATQDWMRQAKEWIEEVSVMSGWDVGRFVSRTLFADPEIMGKVLVAFAHRVIAKHCPASPTSDWMRQEFEQYAKSRFIPEDIRRCRNGRYLNVSVEAMWETWVAARTLEHCPASIPLIRANRFALRCPHCDKENSNSADAGGNERCFHCGSCGFVECEWSSPAHEYFASVPPSPPSLT